MLRLFQRVAQWGFLRRSQILPPPDYFSVLKNEIWNFMKTFGAQ
jgi:hypothetical protein